MAEWLAIFETPESDELAVPVAHFGSHHCCMDEATAALPITATGFIPDGDNGLIDATALDNFVRFEPSPTVERSDNNT
jgi:hypothetical protein